MWFALMKILKMLDEKYIMMVGKLIDGGGGCMKKDLEKEVPGENPRFYVGRDEGGEGAYLVLEINIYPLKCAVDLTPQELATLRTLIQQTLADEGLCANHGNDIAMCTKCFAESARQQEQERFENA